MKTQEDFINYHKENPRVYELFCYFTSKVINAGFLHYSAEAIINQIRWYTDVETSGDQFKIDDHYTPYYSRKWMQEHNKEEFFRTRTSVADNNSPELGLDWD